MPDVEHLVATLRQPNRKSLARAISIVENELPGYEKILLNLRFPAEVPVIGITGPPGAGKSTLINQLISSLSEKNKKVGVVAIDPTSPFNFGSMLGDRIRMNTHYSNNNVYIRSLATRGSLGGISAKAIEVVDLIKSAGFDYVIVETVGVGQSEVEIAGLADITSLVLVPGAGDEIQVMKSGIIEIADLLVVNKMDRPGAQSFLQDLRNLVKGNKNKDREIPVIPVTAQSSEGVSQLVKKLKELLLEDHWNKKKPYLLTEKAYRIIQSQKMKSIDKQKLFQKIKDNYHREDFNLYAFAFDFLKGKLA